MADVPLMSNPMTTEGDIIYGGAAGAPTRLAVGTAGQVLKVNSGADGVEWDDESGGGATFSGCRATRSTTLTGSGTTVDVTFDGEAFDTDGYHDTSSNTQRLTVPATGYYEFGFGAFVAANESGNNDLFLLQINGSTSIPLGPAPANSNFVQRSFSGVSGPLALTAADYAILRFLGDNNHDFTGVVFWVKRLG